TLGLRNAHREAQRLLDQLIETVEARAATTQHKSRGDLRFQARAAQIVANHGQQFHRTRLDDVCESARENSALRAVAYAGNFNGAVLAQKFGGGATVAALDFFRLGNGRTQTHRQIVCEMVAADGYGAGVAN